MLVLLPEKKTAKVPALPFDHQADELERALPGML